MIIKMKGLYGLDHSYAYYRKSGDCFDFVNSIKYASELSKEEVELVFKHKEWYLKQYAAKELTVIDS